MTMFLVVKHDKATGCDACVNWDGSTTTDRGSADLYDNRTKAEIVAMTHGGIVSDEERMFPSEIEIEI